MYLAIEVFCDQQVLLCKASCHPLLLLQPSPQLKLLLGQVVYMLLQRCEVVGLGGQDAVDQAVSQGHTRPQIYSM